MKQYNWLLGVFLLMFHTCIAQGVSKRDERIDIDICYPADVCNYMLKKRDLIVLNSIIEVNGIVHPRDTYGYIDYIDTEGVYKRSVFEQLGGIIVISKKEYNEIIELPDTSEVCIAICLQSPVYGSWGSYWDKVMVKGYFTVYQLNTTRNKLTPCFHFVITSIGKKIFKIQFESWEVQTCYYREDGIPVSKIQRKWLDCKEHRMYKLSHRLHFERKLW